MKRWLEDKTLDIWLNKGLLSTLLLPFSCVYRLISKIDLARKAKHAWQAPVPVIVIGNIIVGGTGKTPLCIAIIKALQQAGWHPGVVSRGYGVNIKEEPHSSDISTHSDYLGDEPSLIYQSTQAPISVHPNRSLAAQALLKSKPEINVLISDDGLQHLSLSRDIEIIVQDQRQIGNGRLIPAGPLREPANRLNQADYVISNLTGSDNNAHFNHPEKPTTANIHMFLKPAYINHLYNDTNTDWHDWYQHKQYEEFNAIAGIGQPQRFFNMLKQAGIKLNKCLPVADHQKISEKLLANLGEANILVTPKDAVKCAKPYDKRLYAVHTELVFNNDKWLKNMLIRLESIASQKK